MKISQILIDQAQPIIEKIATARQAGNPFAYFEPKDLYQETWFMCLEALERYDPDIGPLENYLNRHVANRMKNLMRDRYFRPGYDVATSGHARTKMNLVNALPLDCGDAIEDGVLLGSSQVGSDPTESLLCEETIDYIYDRLPSEFIEVFEDMLGNNKIRKPLEDEVLAEIAKILVDREDDDA